MWKENNMEKKYWLINVPGRNGYSLMVHCNAETAEDAIKMANDAEQFDGDDAREAVAVEPFDDDIIEFKNANLIVEL